VAEAPRVAILVETSTAYGRGVVAGIARYARRHGPWSLFVEPGFAPTAFQPKSWRVSGAIVSLGHLRRPGIQRGLSGIPVVDLDLLPPQKFPHGICNNQPAVGRLAAEHLRTCGLRHFAFCGWGPADSMSTVWEAARRQGFIEAARGMGCEPKVYEWPQRKRDRSWSREQLHLAGWLASLARPVGRPVGLMASNDQRARHVLEAARLAGLRVPDDLAVIGVDNDELLCEMSSPSLSSIALNTGRLGFEAAARLDRLMKRRRVPELPIVVDPTGVVVRRSTDLLALEDQAVAEAVRLIRENAHKPLQVSDILRSVRVSRRSLEMRFRRVLGWSPHQEIARVRLARLQELLASTDWPLSRLAAAAGFSRPEHMHAVFRAATGMTPTRYRALHR
jgi:LacI family transcriptional regulator